MGIGARSGGAGYLNLSRGYAATSTGRRVRRDPVAENVMQRCQVRQTVADDIYCHLQRAGCGAQLSAGNALRARWTGEADDL
jgi:hypothetical protein